MNEQELNEFGLPKFKKETSDVNEFGLPKFKRNQTIEPTIEAPVEVSTKTPDGEEDYFRNSFGNVLRGFDNIVPLGIGDFVDDMARSVAAGYRQGTVAEEADKLLLQGTKASPEQIQQFINARKDLARLGPSKEMQDYQKIYEREGKGFWGVIKGLTYNPSVIPELMASSLTAMATNADALKAGAAAVGTGAGIGASTGAAGGTAVFPVVGTVGGATAGAISGAATSLPYAFGLASSVVEAGSTFGELLEEELGGEEMTKENVKQILEDPDKLQSIRNKAIGRGIIIGTVDALTGKLASGVGAKIIKKGAKSATGVATKGTLAKSTAAGTVIEGLGGSAGEAAARGAIGQQMDVSEIALEGISELPGGIRSTVTTLFESPIEKKTREINQVIDRVADTGSPDINQQIDSEVNDQEIQTGLPSAEQQGAAIVQEGAQPEVSGAQVEAGGVLQVSPETPGAQAEVTGTQVTPEVTPAVTPEVTPEVTPQVTPQEEQDPLTTEGLTELEQLQQPITEVTPEVTTQPTTRIEDIERNEEIERDRLSETVISKKRAITSAEDTEVAIQEYNKAKVALDEFDKNVAQRKDKLRADSNIRDLIETETEASKKDRYEYQKEFEKDPRLAALQSAKDMLDYTNSEDNRIFYRKQGLSEQEIDKNTQRANKYYKQDIADLEADLKANPVVDKEVTAQPTAEQPTVEQPTIEQQVTEQPVQPEVPTAEQPANLNEFKRYFFNKDPKAFGGNLETALGMSQIGWQKAYNKYAKTATPEELKMLDALRGKQTATVVTPEVTEEELTEEDVIIIDKTALLNAGYTNEQVALVENNPEKYAQIDDKIVNIETNVVIKPTGKKKPQPRPKRRPTEKFPKTTFANLEEAMDKPGVKLDELLRIVVGLKNDYSALAEQLLNIYKSNKTVRLVKFTTKRESDEKNMWGVYRYDNTVGVFIKDIKKYYSGSEVTRVLLHEIVHAYTVMQIVKAIPAASSRASQIKALKAYLKHGDNQSIKDIITLYLSARDQIKAALEKKDKNDPVLSVILKEADGTKAYGLLNIKEFLTEAFTRKEFQRLLNRLPSPIAPKKTMYQSFVDAVKYILKIATSGAQNTLAPVKKDSILERVLQIAPAIMVTDKGAIAESKKADMAPAPDDPRTQALIKIAQGLINKGATRENVIDRVKQSLAGKFDIDVDAYADDILAGISVREKEVTGKFNADTEVANIVNTPYNQILTSKKPDNVKPADFKQQQVEALADFLRGKVTSKEQVQDFVLTWNDANPNNQISKNITNEAWDRLKTARPTPAVTTTVKINDIIRTQAQAWAKGKAEGVRETTKQFRDKIIKMVQESVKGSNLTSNQINSILAAVKRVNLFTPGSISKLADRIAQIEAKAELAEKISNAKSLRKQIAKLAKPKEAKVSNYTALARQFLKVDIDYLTSFRGDGFTGIDPLDAYIIAATAIKNGFANPKLEKYERIIVSQIQEYANAQIDFKNIEQAREIAEAATEEQIQQIAVEGMSVKDLKNLVDELQMQERAQELQEQLRELDNPDGILNKLNSVDLNTLDADELSLYIHVADNIIANEDYSMVDRFSNKLLAKERIAELNKTLGSVNKGKLIEGYKGLQQITQMLDAVFNFSKYAATMYNLSGIYDYIAGTARVENRKIAMAKAFEKEIDRIDSKNMGKPQLRLKSEQGKLLMLSELAKYTLDSTEHIEKVHENIQNSIDKWKKEDKKLGDELQKIYDQYKNVKSAEEAIEAFQQNDPHVYELWKYITNDIFTKQLTDEIALNTNSVHNKVFIPFVNYSPTALKTIDIEAAPEEKGRTSAKPVQSGTTKEARRTMSSGQAYDFDDYINNILYAYTETIHDIETSKHLQLFNNVANNAEFENLIGGSNNRNYIIQRVISTDSIERKMGDKVNETVSILNNIAEGISQFGVTTALGGIDQMALQYPSAAVSSMIMLGGDVDLFFAAPTKLNPNMEKAVNKILEKQDIAVRGQAHKYELNNKNFDFKSKSKIMKGLSKIRGGLSYIQKDLLLKPLILSDMSVAQRSYIAFYLKSLRDQGYNKVDLMTEPDKINDPSRKQALAYASLMLSNLQVASTSAGRSAFIQEPGNLGVLRKVMLPFSSFPINTKIRMMRALNKMYSSPKKSEGVQELLAVMTEAATFASIKIYLLPFYYAAVKAGMEAIAGFEAPEDEEDEDRNKNERKLRTQLALEAIPFNVGSVGAWGSQWLINSINYGMSETEARTTKEFLKDMGEDPMFEKLNNWNKYNEFYGYGQYGIGMDRYADIINSGMNYFRDDFVTLDNGYGEQIINKDSHELERLAMMNLLIQALPVTPRELRSQMAKIEREQFKMAKERQSEE